jgi:hypothetical protein
MASREKQTRKRNYMSPGYVERSHRRYLVSHGLACYVYRKYSVDEACRIAGLV